MFVTRLRIPRACRRAASSRRLTILLGLLGLGGCASPSVSSSGDLPRGSTSEQREDFRALESRLGTKLSWVLHDGRTTPRHIGAARGGRPVLRGADAAAATLSLLREHRTLFMLREPEHELTLERTDVDALGMTHVRFQQVVRDVPVAGAELAAHYDASGSLAAIQATTIPGFDAVDVIPSLSGFEAQRRAETSLGTVDSSALEVEPGELVVFVDAARSPHLAYQFDTRTVSGIGRWTVTVDAKTGELLEVLDTIQSAVVTGKGVLGNVRSLEVKRRLLDYVMSNDSAGVSIQTYTANSGDTVPGSLVSSLLPNTWDVVAAGAGAAVDAHFFAQIVRKYYKERLERDGADGLGSPLISTVHYGKKFANAHWNGRQMVFGDGDGDRVALSAGLDVVGHEFTHGVTEKTSGLIYKGQSGALNEAVSDIAGNFIEHFSGLPEAIDWKLGERTSKKGIPIRDFIDPSTQKDPAAMSQFVETIEDNGGVHTNSSIINHAAYLMTMGGTNQVTKVAVSRGIGWEKSEKVWYRANTKYFLKDTDFKQGALGVIAAAEDLQFTPNDRNIIECAFKAVGVLEGPCAEIVDPPPIDPSASDAGSSGVEGAPSSASAETPAEAPLQGAAPPSPAAPPAEAIESGCAAAGGRRGPSSLFGGAAIVGLLLVRRRRAGVRTDDASAWGR